MSSSELRPHATHCDILEWDTAFFECCVARYRRKRCVGADAAALLMECVDRALDCVYIVVDASDTESIATLNRIRARFVDVRLTFAREIASTGAGLSPVSRLTPIRMAVETDIPRLKQIASTSHRNTRFYADPHLRSDQCDRLYETWIEKSCHGYADAVFVAVETPANPIGYVTCHKDGSAKGRIGLFAVDEKHQGRGVGQSLLTSACLWCSANDVGSIVVDTQLRNVGAIRMYERGGLVTSAATFWFHYWPRHARV